MRLLLRRLRLVLVTTLIFFSALRTTAGSSGLMFALAAPGLPERGDSVGEGRALTPSAKVRPVRRSSVDVTVAVLLELPGEEEERSTGGRRGGGWKIAGRIASLNELMECFGGGDGGSGATGARATMSCGGLDLMEDGIKTRQTGAVERR